MARTRNIILTPMNKVISHWKVLKKNVKNIGNMASFKNLYAKTEIVFNRLQKN